MKRTSFRPRQWQPIEPTEAAWLAGILEGEGSFMLIKGRSRTGRRYLPRVSMQSSDEDTITRVHAISGVGVTSGPIIRSNRKPVWMWACSRVMDAVPLMVAVRIFMGKRRGQQIDSILMTLRVEDPDTFDRAWPPSGVLPLPGEEGEPLPDEEGQHPAVRGEAGRLVPPLRA
jgi:hypothetical protein